MGMVSTDEYGITDPLIQNGKSLLSEKMYTVNESWVKPENALDSVSLLYGKAGYLLRNRKNK